ncbi:GyrI-like domain-containing protein [Sulfurospirillum arcachonense]|uniref:GyrI-like domain-containing protein n=1 Tax=Sulfurospirillum arcachonense TaxID=57666 RepID=UPI0004683597|nr:GyrI-like domain-containing protein [Sulfurospirillum arcachonense]
MKYEWRKKEKDIYLPPKKPVMIDIPCFKYFAINSKGNPNSAFFGECIEALYAVSYAIRMSYKKGLQPEGFYEYTVYPLEGIWDISEKAKQSFDGRIDKDELVFKLMIRQPDFVTNEFSETAKEWALRKKGNPLIEKLAFDEMTDGKCVQMMHLGSYDNEPESFTIMEEFSTKNQLKRKSKQHKEIYISDPRKVVPEKLKTVLRVEVG